MHRTDTNKCIKTLENHSGTITTTHRKSQCDRHHHSQEVTVGPSLPLTGSQEWNCCLGHLLKQSSIWKFPRTEVIQGYSHSIHNTYRVIVTVSMTWSTLIWHMEDWPVSMKRTRCVSPTITQTLELSHRKQIFELSQMARKITHDYMWNFRLKVKPGRNFKWKHFLSIMPSKHTHTQTHIP